MSGAVSVTTCADDPNDAGSLRSVLKNVVNNDVVDLTQLNCSVISLSHPSLYVGPINVTLQGPQPPKTLTISGNGHYRVLTHSTNFALNSPTLTIDHLTIAQGKYASSGTRVHGGCIYSYANVTLSHSTVTGCTAREDPGGITEARGGGMYVLGKVSLIESTVSGNTAWSAAVGYAARGGGIFAGEVTMSYSTVTSNTAMVSSGASSYGGGIEAANATLTASTVDSNDADFGAGMILFGNSNNPSAISAITNSTIAANTATTGTGGIEQTFVATLKVLNSTIAFNSSASGVGGLTTNSNNPLTIYSTIIAENATISGSQSDLDVNSAAATSGLHNLVMKGNYSAAGFLSTKAYPRLVPLGNHGGHTRTCALQHFSPALDQGYLSTLLSDDQRGLGYSRSIGFGPDIGAYEFQQIDDDEIFADSFDWALQ